MQANSELKRRKLFGCSEGEKAGGKMKHDIAY